MSDWEDVEVGASLGSSDEWEDVAVGEAKSFSTLDALKNFGSGLVEGTTGFAGLLSDINPLSSGASANLRLQREMETGKKSLFPASEVIAETQEPLLAERDPQYRYYRTAGNYAAPLPFPGANSLKSVGTSLLSGVAAQGAEDATGNSTVAPLLASFATGAGVQKLANAAADALPAAGGNMERFALGARPSDYTRSLKARGADVVDGEVTSSIKDAFDDVINRGTFKGINSAEDAFIKNDEAINGLSKQLNAVLSQVDEIKGKTPVFPKLQIAREYVKNNATTPEKAGLLAYIDDYENALKSTDGSLSALQKEKLALGRKVYGGRDVGKESVDKYIQSDLRQTIENETKKVLGEAPEVAGTVKQLNSQLGNHLEVENILTRRVGQEEGANWLTSLMQKLRTSGGTITTPAIIGGFSGGPVGAIAGAGLGAGLGYATSPGGSLKIARGLKAGKGLEVSAADDAATLARIASGGSLDLPETLQNETSGILDYKKESQSTQQQGESKTETNQNLEAGDELDALLQQLKPRDKDLSKKSAPSLKNKPDSAANQEDFSGLLGLEGASGSNASIFGLKNNSLFDVEDMAKTPEFEQKAAEVADRLGVEPLDLLKVIGFETGGSFSATQKNKAGSGATGLIQFMPETAKELLKTETKQEAIKQLEQMSDLEQLDVVEKYLSRYKGKIKTLDDLYMAVLYPKAIDKDAEYALFKEGTIAYKQNKGLDLDKDGRVTKNEAASKVRNYNV